MKQSIQDILGDFMAHSKDFMERSKEELAAINESLTTVTKRQRDLEVRIQHIETPTKKNLDRQFVAAELMENKIKVIANGE